METVIIYSKKVLDQPHNDIQHLTGEENRKCKVGVHTFNPARDLCTASGKTSLRRCDTIVTIVIIRTVVSVLRVVEVCVLSEIQISNSNQLAKAMLLEKSVHVLDGC